MLARIIISCFAYVSCDSGADWIGFPWGISHDIQYGLYAFRSTGIQGEDSEGATGRGRSDEEVL
jgi:hypothetical protein